MSRIDFVRSGAVRFLAVVTFLLAAAVPALAQDDNSDTQPGDITVHIVQSGDTLFGIAERYGTSFDAIVELNELDNPGLLDIGQRLLIPNAQPAQRQSLPPLNAPPGEMPSLSPPNDQRADRQRLLPSNEQPTSGMAATHIVGPGDTLDGLVARYNTTREALATANNLSNPDLLYIGQQLILPPDPVADGPVGNGPSSLFHTVRPGQNIFRLAIQYGAPVYELMRANDLEWPSPIFFGQTLLIPETRAAGHDAERAANLPYPLADVQFRPLPVMQGNTLSISLVSDGAATVSGTFLDRPLRFASHDGGQHNALVGIDALAPPGIYPLTMVIETPSGQRAEYTTRVEVRSAGFQTEEIELTGGQDEMLDPSVTDAEDALIAQVTSGFSTTRTFGDLMRLPSTGLVTSEFGTRRSYNHGALNSYHTGTDFGAWPGSPIEAPAAGVVVMTESLTVRGNATIIDHGWGVYSGFWHQSEFKVRVGDVVTQGQEIGTVGSTGRSTGPHLHWELWVSGVQVDPLQWGREVFP